MTCGQRSKPHLRRCRGAAFDCDGALFYGDAVSHRVASVADTSSSHASPCEACQPQPSPSDLDPRSGVRYGTVRLLHHRQPAWAGATRISPSRLPQSLRAHTRTSTARHRRPQLETLPTRELDSITDRLDRASRGRAVAAEPANASAPTERSGQPILRPPCRQRRFRPRHTCRYPPLKPELASASRAWRSESALFRCRNNADCSDLVIVPTLRADGPAGNGFPVLQVGTIRLLG